MVRFLCTSIKHAIADGNVGKFKELIGDGRRVDVPDNSGWLPLHNAVVKNRKDMVQVLLSHSDTEVNYRTPEGYTALWLACDSSAGNIDIARSLLDNGADPNIPDNRGVCPLQAACKYGNVALVELLIHHQADINRQDSFGCTPLHYAVYTGSRKVIKSLLAHGADANVTQAGGLNALMLSLLFGRSSHVDLLLRHTQNLDAVSADGSTALLLAFESLNWNAVQTLLDGGASMATKGQYLNVLFRWLVRGVQPDVEQLQLHFQGRPDLVALWQIIFTKSTPNVTQHTIATAIQYRDYDLAHLLITYCLHLNPKKLIVFLYRQIPASFIRNWLSIFTLTRQCRRLISYRLSSDQSDGVTKMLKDTKPVKSLVELSRDTVREAIRLQCNTTRDFLAALEELQIPEVLKDIIRLRQPVNRY